MTLPSITRLPATPTDRQRLADWIAEWTLLLATESNGELETPPATRPSLQLHVLSDAAPIQTGDIRLLHPEIEPTALRYVAVVAPHSATAWTVLPFGLLSEPATPDEIRTDRTPPPLRVLCPWNRLQITTAHLQRCWLADQLTPEEAMWLGSALSMHGEHAPHPPERTGPALRHPLDPRHDYRAREAAFRQRLTATVASPLRYDTTINPSALLKAAEDRAPYGTAERKPPPEGEPS
ncbi:MAG: hypothetical protein HQ523_10635 [Lentisphaerae bacterium]|nr:hypothetical protein [Lentisphaerota bacterium]